MDPRLHTPAPAGKSRALRTLLPLLAAALLGMWLLPACSTKKNTPYSRNYQAFITRYNVYFNGDEHFKETLREMEKSYEDDYTQRLFIHPAEAREHPKSPQPKGDFNRSIEKAQKAIQLHSIKQKPKKKSGKGNDPAYKEWLKRSEYNPFLHNAWLMMGRSQYYNGDFAGAASTFMYTAKHFGWLPRTVTEARLWEALCYCAMDWLYEAEVIITRIKPDQLDNKTLKGLYALARADLLVRQRNYEEAVPAIEEAIKYASKPQKTRLWFLLGQVNSALDRKEAAYQAFKKAGSAVNATYRTKLNARIRQSEVYMGGDIEPEVKALRRMTRYDRNKDYLDQIYYAIGNLYLSRGDTLNAIENYKLAAEKSTRSGIDKAISQVTLGGLYFDRREYNLAQPCYSEGVPPLPDDYPDRALLKRRSDVLDELAVYSQNVQLQDSLLRLAAMDSTERMQVILGIIADLNKREKEEADAARREAAMAEREGMDLGLNNKGQTGAPTSFQIGGDDSWYFYNRQAISQGKTEFQRRWGARKLEDNWRRRNKSSFSFEETADEEEGEETAESEGEELTEEEAKEKEALDRASDPHYPEYYLAQIPSTPEEIATSNDIIQEGLYNMGVILKDKLGDVDAAAAELQQLNNRYPDNVYRLDAYYNLYLMFMQANRPDEAEHWRQAILTDFADSPYGIALQNPDYIESLREMLRIEEQTYRQALDDYMANRNTAVHAAYDKMKADYPLSKLMPRFMFLDALAYVTENKPDEFSATLRELLERYPDTDLSPLASAYMKGLNAGRRINSGGANARGMLWDTRLLTPNDTTAQAGGEAGPVEFKLAPDSPHMLLLLYELGGGPDAVNPNALLYNVARYNFLTYNVRDFDIDQMSFPPLGILAVKGLDNESEARRYRNGLEDGSSFEMPGGVRPVIISTANFDAMLHSGASFEEYFKFIGDTLAVTARDKVLPPDEYEHPADDLNPAPPAEVVDQLIDELPLDELPLDEADGTTEEPLPALLPEESKPEESKPAPAPKPAAPKAETAPKPAAPAPKPLPAVEPGSEGPDDLLDD